MGEFKSVEKFINNNVNIQKYLKENNPYSRFLESTPTFVKYFAINNIESTLDEGLKDTESLLGDSSSIRYNLIEDFPLWGIENLNLNITEEDYGNDLEIQGEAIILPNTIMPSPDDYFVINYLGDEHLFRITNFEVDTIKSNHYFKVQFEYRSNRNHIYNQVKEKFNCIFENIGTDYKVIINIDDKNKLEEIKKLSDSLKELYCRLFYNKKLNSFILPTCQGHVNIYDSFLTEFIIKSKVFEDQFNLFPIYIENDFNVNEFLFNKTIYNAILKRTIRNLDDYIHANPIIITNSMSRFSKFRESYTVIDFYFKTTSTNSIQLMPKEFIDRIITNNLYLDDEHNIENIIIKYLNNNTLTSSDLLSIDADILYVTDARGFLYVPMLLYILKVESYSINRNKTNNLKTIITV